MEINNRVYRAYVEGCTREMLVRVCDPHADEARVDGWTLKEVEGGNEHQENHR